MNINILHNLCDFQKLFQDILYGWAAAAPHLLLGVVPQLVDL